MSKAFESMEYVIQQRREQPMENSYTCYLFEKGMDKILKKVGEETSETIIAAKNGDRENLVGEFGNAGNLHRDSLDSFHDCKWDKISYSQHYRRNMVYGQLLCKMMFTLNDCQVFFLYKGNLCYNERITPGCFGHP